MWDISKQFSYLGKLVPILESLLASYFCSIHVTYINKQSIDGVFFHKTELDGIIDKTLSRKWGLRWKIVKK